MDKDQKPTAEEQAKELSIKETLQSQINNPELSDCVFLVGEQRTRIYAHKCLLAMSNPVFKSMFYGVLKETKFEIEIPDLHEKGFLNLISYLYTKEIPAEFDLPDIYWTVTAANKYLANEFVRRLLDYVSFAFQAYNVCLIYNQLLKLELGDESLIKEAGRKIKEAERMIKTDEVTLYFIPEIDQHTLESILRFDQLYIKESTLLSYCLDWTDVELEKRGLEATAENKRSVFAGIKHLIGFGDLETSELVGMNIEDYLTSDELASCLLHLSDKSKPLIIDYRSPRVLLQLLTVEIITNSYDRQVIRENSVFETECKLKVNKKVFLREIETQPVLVDCGDSIVCEIFRENQSLDSSSCYYDDYTNSLRLFHFPPIELKPGLEYRFSFKSSKPLKEPGILRCCKELTARSKDDQFVFTMTGPHHCIAKIIFYPVLLYDVPLRISSDITLTETAFG